MPKQHTAVINVHWEGDGKKTVWMNDQVDDAVIDAIIQKFAQIPPRDKPSGQIP